MERQPASWIGYLYRRRSPYHFKGVFSPLRHRRQARDQDPCSAGRLWTDESGSSGATVRVQSDGRYDRRVRQGQDSDQHERHRCPVGVFPRRWRTADNRVHHHRRYEGLANGCFHYGGEKNTLFYLDNFRIYKIANLQAD